MIENGPRKSIMLDKKQSVAQRVRARQFSSAIFKSLNDIHNDKLLVLDNEDRAAREFAFQSS